MAHEELKKLYEIDKQHSDNPAQYWQLRTPSGHWIDCCVPGFFYNVEYRRKPDAPAWPVQQRVGSIIVSGGTFVGDYCRIHDLPDGEYDVVAVPVPALIQGHTAEQWQTIIDGEFLCEFSDDGGDEDDSVRISVLRELCPERFPFYSGFGSKWKYCRPLRTKGVRQPWFGGECPISSSALVVVTLADGDNRFAKASEFNWHLPDNKSRRIVEFIEL